MPKNKSEPRKLEYHVYLHFPDGSVTQPVHQEILTLLHALGLQGAQIMTKLDDITAQLDAIDAQTNEIAADIDKLIAGGLTGLSEADADAVIARLTATADTLRTIAAKS